MGREWTGRAQGRLFPTRCQGEHDDTQKLLIVQRGHRLCSSHGAPTKLGVHPAVPHTAQMKRLRGKRLAQGGKNGAETPGGPSSPPTP